MTVRLCEVPVGDPVAVAALERYHDELGARFPEGFEPGPTALGSGVFVVGLIDGVGGPAVACGGVQPLGTGVPGHEGYDVGEVKRMWVDPDHRGTGLGRRLLGHLEGLARERGHTRLLLDTHDRLVEAIGLYERSGYVAVPAYNVNPHARAWFAKPLRPALTAPG